MKTAAPNLLVAITVTVALSAGLVLTAGDPAVFETRQASILVFDDTSGPLSPQQADSAQPIRVKAVAPADAAVQAGIRS
jgi:hypothetical protein